jgi:hypothetical protein
MLGVQDLVLVVLVAADAVLARANLALVGAKMALDEVVVELFPVAGDLFHRDLRSLMVVFGILAKYKRGR